MLSKDNCLIGTNLMEDSIFLKRLFCSVCLQHFNINRGNWYLTNNLVIFKCIGFLSRGLQSDIGKEAFRDWFAQLGELSTFYPNAPLLALKKMQLIWRYYGSSMNWNH